MDVKKVGTSVRIVEILSVGIYVSDVNMPLKVRFVTLSDTIEVSVA